jgi:uncharacterized protein YebE (UPF0316 family)
MSFGMVGEMAVTAGMAVIAVSLWTVRIAVTARGNRLGGAMIAAIEAMVFIMIFSQVMSGFGSAHRVIAYGIGVAIGTTLGLTVDRRINPQLNRLDIVAPSGSVGTALTAQGWEHTQTTAVGIGGPVTVVSIVATERNVSQILATVAAVDPAVQWTVTPVRRTNTASRTPPASVVSISSRMGRAIRGAQRTSGAAPTRPVALSARSRGEGAFVADRAV